MTYNRLTGTIVGSKRTNQLLRVLQPITWQFNWPIRSITRDINTIHWRYNITLTRKMTTAQVVETSVTVTNTSFQNDIHPDDHTKQTTDTPGFKPFTKLSNFVCNSFFSRRVTNSVFPFPTPCLPSLPFHSGQTCDALRMSTKVSIWQLPILLA